MPGDKSRKESKTQALSRRSFLTRLGAAVAVGAAAGTIGRFQPSDAAPRPQAETADKLEAKKGDYISQVCINCGRHPARSDSHVCSPLCNMYRADDMIKYMGEAAWEDFRLQSQMVFIKHKVDLQGRRHLIPKMTTGSPMIDHELQEDAKPNAKIRKKR